MNKRAKFDYHILKEYEFGLSLLGWEVKSIRSKKINITSSYVKNINNQLYWLGADFAPLKTVTTPIDRNRMRKILAHRKEITQIQSQINEKKLAMVVLSLIEKRGLFKLNAALAKGKSHVDKRRSIKNKEWKVQKQRIERMVRK